MLSDYEKKFFSPANFFEVSVVENINAKEVVNFARNISPDVICLFGTSILNKDWLDAFPSKIINLHLGLSPFYRGSATLFWPFYYQELSCVGSTIHLAIDKVDAGAILKRIKATFVHGDSYYDITTRLIRDSIDAFPSIVKNYLDGKIIPISQEGIDGRLMRKADFCEKALVKVLDYVGDKGISVEMIDHISKLKKCHCSQ
jgi:methionyl-tRNA formyltransferase